MNIIISNSIGESIYEQIKKAIKQAIYSNELKEGEILPSVRVMANDLKISFLTVKKAYDDLEIEGFIKTVQGKRFRHLYPRHTRSAQGLNPYSGSHSF